MLTGKMSGILHIRLFSLYSVMSEYLKSLHVSCPCPPDIFIILIAIISHHWINAIFFSEGYGIISSFKGHGHAGLHVSRASSLPTSLSTSNRSRVWPFREEVLRRIFQLLWHIVAHGALHDRCSSKNPLHTPQKCLS